MKKPVQILVVVLAVTLGLLAALVVGIGVFGGSLVKKAVVMAGSSALKVPVIKDLPSAKARAYEPARRSARPAPRSDVTPPAPTAGARNTRGAVEQKDDLHQATA